MITKKSSSILGLATALPEFCVSQEAYAQFVCEALGLSGKYATFLKNICARSAINQRYFVVQDPLKKRDEWTFFSSDYPQTIPTTAAREKIYEQEAPRLAGQAVKRALQDWGQDKGLITHVISVSCTGALAPGIEFLLIDDIGLSRSVQRFGLNFIGCFGAMRGLSVAHALAQENPRNRVLLVCTELCSLHFQADLEPHHFVGNALFADGSAAVIVGSEPTAHEKPLWEIVRFKSQALEHSRDDMTWKISDRGFVMYLSVRIPQLLTQYIDAFVQELVESVPLAETLWAIHPGGKAIIQGIEKACRLESWQTQASWETLASYGNMSSATLLFVLDRLRSNKQRASSTVALAFGPGLSLEGLLLKRLE